MAPKTYTVRQFITAYNLSRSTLYRLWQQGTGPTFLKVGRKVLITVEAAEQWAHRTLASTDAKGAE